MARVDNNGTAIHYEVEGSGPPVVLMHGMGGSIQNWVRAGYVDALRDECREDAWMGFTGKITIHPDQIAIVNEAFTPSREEVAEAEELLAAFREAEAGGRMAFSFKGQMVDVPHLRRAETIGARAGAAGSDD